MTEIVQRGRLYVGSYVGLFALLAIRFDTTWVRLVCVGLAALGAAFMLWIVFVVARRAGAEPIRVVEVEDAGSEISGYLATYLLPFLTVASPNVRDVVAYAIFLGIGGLIYVRSEMTQVNPTLYLLGRRVAKVSTKEGWRGYVIVKTHPETDEVIRVVSLNSAVRVEVRRRQEVRCPKAAA